MHVLGQVERNSCLKSWHNVVSSHSFDELRMCAVLENFLYKQLT